MKVKTGTRRWRNEEQCRRGVSTLGRFVSELLLSLIILQLKTQPVCVQGGREGGTEVNRTCISNWVSTKTLPTHRRAKINFLSSCPTKAD